MTAPQSPAPRPQPLLQIAGLTVAYRDGDALQDAVREFALEIAPGQTYGLVGESGSGKSTVALAIMGYLPAAAVVRAGTIHFAGRDLLALPRAALQAIWGAELALVPQDPLSSLNPSIPVGRQLAEPLRQHFGLGETAARRRAAELLEMVRLPDPGRTARSYPHQLSGGMQQRVLIAMALSTEPRLLILDEPTTALDVTTQAAILELLGELIRGRDTAALYVTHNMGVVARICDRVAVLYAGELVEDAATADLFARPLHPYTRGLLDSLPRPGQSKRQGPLAAIPGAIPALDARPPACIYAPRCPLAIDICHEERPPLDRPAADRLVRCHRWPEIAAGEISAQVGAPAGEGAGQPGSGAEAAAAGAPDLPAPMPADATNPTLCLDDVKVHFKLRRPVRDVLAGRPARRVRAVDGVDLTIAAGQTLGLVGESGSGKTTLARAVMGLEEVSGGEMRLGDEALPSGLGGRSRALLRRLQIVFQNPEEALNPFRTVGQTLRRPLQLLHGLDAAEADRQVERLLASVRLPAAFARRRPDQLSGGEKQRVAIARAFAANPDLLVADEPISSLDVSVQASILNLLNELQAEHGTSDLFISHDLAVVGYLADHIAVIYAGELMEVAPAEELFRPPFHPYTEALLSAIPIPDPQAAQEPIPLPGDGPSQVEAPGGCPFHARCPRFLGPICVTERPPWRETGTGTRIFCHIPLDDLVEAQAS